MSEKAAKTRVSVTVTKSYVDALDYLVEEGIYVSRGDAVLEALRLLFGSYGIAPFYLRGVRPEAEDVDR